MIICTIIKLILNKQNTLNLPLRTLTSINTYTELKRFFFLFLKLCFELQDLNILLEFFVVHNVIIHKCMLNIWNKINQKYKLLFHNEFPEPDPLGCKIMNGHLILPEK